MASSKKNNNLFSGRIGPLIYYVMNGKQYLRTAPSRVKYPNTPKQQQYKQTFALSSTLASKLYAYFDGWWFLETQTEGQRSFAQLKKRIQQTGIRQTEEGIRYDFEQLILTEGSLYQPQWSVTDNLLRWNLPEKPLLNAHVFVIGIQEESLAIHLVQASLEQQELKLIKQEKTHYYAFIQAKRGTKTKLSTSVKV